MKILHVTDSGGMHGKEMVIKNLISEHSKEHECHFVNLYSHKEIEQVMYDAGALPIPDINGSLYNTSRHLLKLIKQQHYDVIHTHDCKSGIIINTLKIFNKLPPVIKTLHGYTRVTGDSRYRLMLTEMLDRKMLRLNNNTVTVSSNLDYLANSVISNGITVDHFIDDSLDPKIMSFFNGFVIGTVSRLSIEKNHAGLIKAFSNMPATTNKGEEVRLIIMGDGKLMNQLQDQVNKLPENISSRIMLPGNIPNAGKYIKHMSLYVQPSFIEGLPISILESIAQGTPTAGTGAGDMKKLITQQAILPLSIDSTILKDDLTGYMNTPKLLKQYSVQGEGTFHAYYTAVRMAKSYMKIYNIVIKSS